MFRRPCVFVGTLRLLSTKSSVVYVKASDVAACVGKNSFKTPSEMLDEYWKRYSSSTFVGLTKIEEQLLAVQRMPEAEKQEYVRAVETQTVSAIEMNQLLESTAKKILASPLISADDKEKVLTVLTGTLQTGLGTRTEDVIAQKVAAQEQVSLEKDFKIYRLPLIKLGSTRYVLRGKIDRLQPEGDKVILVEIKSRARKLFNRLREYENIQVQTYLQLLPPHLQIHRARLIEQFEDQRNSFEIVRDDALWSELLLPGLVTFCGELDKAMKQH
jgi:hypothetical protein